jgi:hypothetical protein
MMWMRKALVLLLLAVCGLACAGNPPAETAEVVVRAVGGEECVSLEPDPVEIWRSDVPGRPHQVRWTVQGEGSYRVELEHDAGKGGDDFFGKRVVACGAPERRVLSGLPRGLPPGGDGEDETWGYRVTLYGCEPGAPEPVCTRDPVIIIRDTSYP